jgi:Na+-driven multidrug efflux pump
MAGSGAAGQITNLAYAFTGGFGAATTTFMGQNIGAKNHDRVKKSFWYFLMFAIIIGGGVGLLLYCLCEPLLGAVVGASATAAIACGKIRMSYITRFVFLNSINNVISHAMMAYGYPLFSSVKSIVFTLGFRVIWMQLLYPQNPTFDMIFMCFTVSWTIDMLFGAIVITIFNRRYSKGKYKKI